MIDNDFSGSSQTSNANHLRKHNGPISSLSICRELKEIQLEGEKKAERVRGEKEWRKRETGKVLPVLIDRDGD